MRLIRNASIASKLILLGMLAVIAALTMAALLLYAYETSATRDAAVNDCLTLAAVIAHNSESALTFNDPEAGAATLKSLEFHPVVQSAALYKDKELFSVYQRNGEAPPAEEPRFSQPVIYAEMLQIVHPIQRGSEKIGAVYIRQRVIPIAERLRLYTWPLILGILVALLGGLVASLWLQRFISGPIEHLTRLVQNVSAHKDYSLRAESIVSRDETGVLASCINDMLGQIEDRDAALRKSQELLSAIINNTTVVIFVKDLEGRYLLVNREYERLIKKPFSEIRSKTDYELYPPEVAKKVRDADEAVVSKGTVLQFEEEVPFDNRIQTFLASKFPLRDFNGAIVGVCGIATDITERKRLEEQLLQAQKMESIGRLAGGIAHDFNNILTAITGYNELAIIAAAENGRIVHYLEELGKSADRAAALTQQMLGFARRQVIRPTIICLNDVVKKIETMLHRLIGEHIELRVQLSPLLGNVKADPGQLEQILLNMSVNARDAMPNGGTLLIESMNTVVTEDITSRIPDSKTGHYVQINVSDTGEGMTSDVLERIFEPFFTTKEIGKGTGLGLATCFGIVKQNGGFIVAHSEPQKGTCFKVYLPLIEERKDELPRATSTRTISKGHETILVAEDEESVRRIVLMTLRDAGYTVLEATNGEDALMVAANYPLPIHLLLSDMVMPKMSGVELAQKLYAIRPKLRIMLMSGYTEDSIQSNEVGVVASFLAKPFTPGMLAVHVRAKLDAAE